MESINVRQASTRAGLREEEAPDPCTAARRKAGSLGSQRRRGGEAVSLVGLGPEQEESRASQTGVAWTLGRGFEVWTRHLCVSG